MADPDIPRVISYLPHIKLTMTGGLGDSADGTASGPEIWACGLRLHSAILEAAPPTVAELQALSDAWAVPVRAWFVNPNSDISGIASLTVQKVVWVLANGKQRDVNTIVHDFASNTRGGGSNIPIWEQSYAITLRTALNRGRGHAGRIYPPVSGGQPAAVDTPYLAFAEAAQMGSAADTFINALNSVGKTTVARATDLSVSIMSTGVDVRPPIANVVTRLVVDRVADIQHRRTDRVPRLESTTYPVLP